MAINTKPVNVVGQASPVASDYVPGLGTAYLLQSSDVFFTTVSGQGITTGSVAANSTAAVTVDHSTQVVFNLNTVPEVETSTAGLTVAVGEIHPDHFVVNVTNSTASAVTGTFNYSRTGL